MAKIYKTKPELLRFYENWNMKLATEYKHHQALAVVSRNYRDAIGCYILRDVQYWNVAKVCHAQPRSVGSFLFAIPFLVSFAEMDTQRKINQIIYEISFSIQIWHYHSPKKCETYFCHVLLWYFLCVIV
eukprot:942163_1